MTISIEHPKSVTHGCSTFPRPSLMLAGINSLRSGAAGALNVRPAVAWVATTKGEAP
jgi:hypothetical protein